MKATPRRRRIRLEEGIFRDGQALIGLVRVGSMGAPKIGRWELGTDRRIIRAWRAQMRGELLEQVEPSPHEGSIAADVPAFLAMLPEGRYRNDTTALMKHWADSPLGQMARQDIVRTDLLAQRSRWLEQGIAIQTVNHRLRALRVFYRTLDGEDVPHPTDKIPRLSPPRRVHRFLPMPYVERILAAMPDRGQAPRFGQRPTYNATKIRLTIMAWTGIPPIQLERLRPRDVDLRGGRMYLHERQKGRGAAASWVSICPAAVDAFRAFARAGLWGRSWSRQSASEAWKGAIRRVLASVEAEAKTTGDYTEFTAFADAIPPRCRPYDLRHSFATEVYRLTGDIRAVAELLQHANLETSKIYTGGAVSERVTSAIDKLARAHPGDRQAPFRVVVHR